MSGFETVKRPTVCCYGIAVNPFVNYIRSGSFVDSVLSGGVKSNGRAGCYSPSESILSLANNAAALVGVSISDCEVFAPGMSHPPRVDEGGLVMAIPLTGNAKLTVLACVVRTEKWGTYIFQDTLPHSSRGVFFMAKVCTPKV